MIGPKDKVIMYTDGIIEAEDVKGKQLGINGFIEFFKLKFVEPETAASAFADIHLYSARFFLGHFISACRTFHNFSFDPRMD